MSFCPKCGAPLKAEAQAPQAPTPPPTTTQPPVRMTNEKQEKYEERGEKREKREKGEKGEKHEGSFIAAVIGGLVLILIGILSYLQITNAINGQIVGAVFLVIIGIAIIIGGLYAVTMARRRHPRA